MTADTSGAASVRLLERAGRDKTSDPTWIVPLSDVLVDAEIEAAVVDTLRSGWWSMGERVADFEEQFASFCGVQAAFAVANGTAALHLALLAVGCGPGDEVLVPSLNFVAAANTIGHVGATPVFCDVEADDRLTVDPVDLEAAVSPATRAIVVMHYGGHPCRMDAILEVARRHDLHVIEDAAHAVGAELGGRACGAIGNIGCFSFFSNKNLPTGEGGMVVTDDDELAARIRLLRSHGMTTLTWDRHRGHAHTYDVVAQGYNYRFDELRAAIGLAQLPHLRARNAARGRIVSQYRSELEGVGGLTMPFASEGETTPAYHLAVVVLPEACSRDAFRQTLAGRGIQTSVHYPPIHEFTYYRSQRVERPLPVTDALAKRIVTIPLYPHMTDGDIAAVTSAVREGVS
jgi:dTDP-4-amino-4,6-dideoxygalactose transaminase